MKVNSKLIERNRKMKKQNQKQTTNIIILSLSGIAAINSISDNVYALDGKILLLTIGGQ